MPKPNNPYSRPINATKDGAMTIGEYYGTRSTDKGINHSAGKVKASPAFGRYSSAPYEGPTNAAPSDPAPKKTKAKPHSVRNEEVTAEDLFEW